MKTIKIFLASSEEMDYDRMVFGNLVRRLDDIYEKRGLRIKLFEWEDHDAAFNDRRKQDEYNDKVKESDVFLALFHKKAGKFTVEEFDVASEAFREKASPKVYTYLRDLQPGEESTPELEEFKRRLFDEMGHYWCRYDNRDSLQLQFVMQLQLVESGLGDSLKVDDGEVCIDGMKVASMDRLKFAAANEDYLKQQNEIRELRDEIGQMQLSLEKKRNKLEKKKARMEENPDDEDYQEEYREEREEVEELVEKLQPKLDKYNKLKEEFAEYQKLLFNTARRVAQLQGERITERMRRAMDAFNEGKVREANIILDEAEADAERNFEDYKQSKEITEQKRQTVICSIEELLLKTSIIMANVGIPIGDREERINSIYSQALDMAQVIDYDQAKLLEDYRSFLSIHSYHFYAAGEAAYKNGDLKKAATMVSTGIEALCRAFSDSEEYPVQGIDSFYELFGRIYYKEGTYAKALEMFLRTLDIRNEIYVSDKNRPGFPDFSRTYNYIGAIYLDQHKYDLAIEYLEKALEALDSPHITIDKRIYLSYGNIYGNLGAAFKGKGNGDKAKEYLLKAHTIFMKTLGQEHPKTKSISEQITL